MKETDLIKFRSLLSNIVTELNIMNISPWIYNHLKNVEFIYNIGS